MNILIDIILFSLGLVLVLRTLISAVKTFLLPRAAGDMIARGTFLLIRRAIFNPLIAIAPTFERKDSIMALYAPVSLVVLGTVWLMLVDIGYTLMFWAAGQSFYDAVWLSGSSLLTLGFAPVDSWLEMLLAFSEAALGLLLVAMFIAYLPTMYSAFSKRETLVTRLEVRAGSPPSAVEMLLRLNRLHDLNELGNLWADWELWFVELDETHTSLAALSFFRSPQWDRHWVTAAGAVLDAAAMHAAVLDVPRDVRADTCIRAGYVALRHIASFFRVSYNPNPRPYEPISVTEAEFNEAYDILAEAGLPLKPRAEAWWHWSGWRVNYDSVLVALAGLTMAPPAAWSSDRLPGMARQPLTATPNLRGQPQPTTAPEPAPLSQEVLQSVE